MGYFELDLSRSHKVNSNGVVDSIEDLLLISNS